MSEKTRNRIYSLCLPLLTLLAVITLVIGVKMSRQSDETDPSWLYFEGEYSMDGSDFKTLNDNVDLNGHTLSLRGHFDMDVPDNGCVQLYLPHLSISIRVNGEERFSYQGDSIDPDNHLRDVCGRQWVTWLVDGDISKDDLIEIELVNEHDRGNGYGMWYCLDNMYVGTETDFVPFMQKVYQLDWTVGLVCGASAVLLALIAISYVRIDLKLARHMIFWAVFTMFAAGYYIFDSVNFNLNFRSIALATYGREISLMLAGVSLLLCITDTLAGKRRKCSYIAAAVSGVDITVMMIVVLTGRVGIFSIWKYWMPVIFLAYGATMICSVIEFIKHRRPIQIFYIVIILSVMLEMVNMDNGWYRGGIIMKPLFMVTYIFYVIKVFRDMGRSYRRAKEAEEIEEELKNSRIFLAMSQIRSHFIFNVLNAISGMCKYDPEKADETVICFSRYLRANVDMMEEDVLHPFSTEYQHLADYIKLEQIRFGEDVIKFKTDIETMDFLIPPMLLQPIVENCIQHGLRPKPEGGTITLSVHKVGENIEITVSDDGVGYTIGNERVGSVGMKNVQFRLKSMANGTMEVWSEPGKGTSTKLIMPERKTA